MACTPILYQLAKQPINSIVLLFPLYFSYTPGQQLLRRLIPQESRAIVATFLIIIDVRYFLNKVIIQMKAILTTLAPKRAM
eukprot:4810500-Ditylum_brightwellii.AAC.1